MANLIDNAIQQLFKDGCKIVKLWENASPTSSFEGQRILWSISEKGYDTVIVVDNYGKLHFATIDAAGPVGVTTVNGNESSSSRIYARRFYPRLNYIEFTDSYNIDEWNSTVNTYANTTNIPVEIYGIKSLWGGGHSTIARLKSFFSIRERRWA